MIKIIVLMVSIAVHFVRSGCPAAAMPRRAGLNARWGKLLLVLFIGMNLSRLACAADGEVAGSDAASTGNATLSANPATNNMASNVAPAGSSLASNPWLVYGQYTNTYQWHPAFSAPGYNPDAQSLNPSNNGEQTNDTTLYLGYRIDSNTEIWINPEYDQGFGLSNTFGVAGYVSGEAYKVGAANPYYRTSRLFIRKVFNLGGESQHIDAQMNQMAESRTANNVIVTLGKFSVVDVFDTNAYAHDPRNDFLNWSIIDAGAFDYAADAWGYSYGGSVEWTQSWWTLRSGIFDMPIVPNSEKLSENLSELEWVAEFEGRENWFVQPGKIKLLVFVNHGNMGSYKDALQLAAQTGTTPSTALVRRFASRPGIALNIEQGLTSDLGLFARGSLNGGNEEEFAFTDINQSFSGGLSLQGDRWGRADDTVGLAGVFNGLSNAARNYFAAGGMGGVIGDGSLPQYAGEAIVELYYACHISAHITVTLDYQHINNPAYNAERGPVDVFGIRTHLVF